jgi:nucleoside triphosphatase
MKQRYPEPTVGALILDRKGWLLLVRSNKWFEKLTIPGGHIELGETMEQALRREVREEVGMNVREARFLIMQEAIFSPEFWKKRHFIFFDFVCRCDDDEKVTVDNKEIQDYLWVEPSEALKMNIDSFVRRSVEELLKERGKKRASRKKQTTSGVY